MEKIVNDLLKKRKINKIYFVACGGSLAAFYPAKFFLEKESRSLVRIGWHPANEFVHNTPCSLDDESLVVICSHQGTTPETLEAGRVARKAGAATVAFTYAPESPIVELGDYVIVYSWGEGQIFSKKKECLGLKLAMELLHQLEDWSGYDKAMEAFEKYDEIAENARNAVKEEAIRFGQANKDEKVIYTLGSGATWGSAYMESICILLEMQWINSACIHCGEFFHGPLEITDPTVPFLLFKGAGPNRALDERVESFLARFDKKVYILDAAALGINKLAPEVAEYFSPLLLNICVDIYNQSLADERSHPLSMRRYMWKISY